MGGNRLIQAIGRGLAAGLKGEDAYPFHMHGDTFGIFLPHGPEVGKILSAAVKRSREVSDQEYPGVRVSWGYSAITWEETRLVLRTYWIDQRGSVLVEVGKKKMLDAPDPAQFADLLLEAASGPGMNAAKVAQGRRPA